MTRRALFGLLPVVAVAQPGNGITVEWSHYEVKDGSNVRTSQGVQVEIRCDPRAAAHIAGYEITFRFREDTMAGKGNPEARTKVVPPWEPFWSLETTGRESWIEIQVTALIRSGMRAAETVQGQR